jgi:hypothetical protein
MLGLATTARRCGAHSYFLSRSVGTLVTARCFADVRTEYRRSERAITQIVSRLRRLIAMFHFRAAHFPDDPCQCCRLGPKDQQYTDTGLSIFCTLRRTVRRR